MAWINVKESQPNRSGFYLVWDEFKTVGETIKISFFDKEWKRSWWVIERGEANNYPIWPTYWRHLPYPPDK